MLSGDWYGDKEQSKGLQTSQDARFYAITSKFDKTFDVTGKDLVFQFSIKMPQKMDCGGGYAKLLPAGADQKNFNGETPYYVMVITLKHAPLSKTEELIAYFYVMCSSVLISAVPRPSECT